MPRPESVKELGSAEFKAKCERGPRLVFTVLPKGVTPMGALLAQWFAYAFVISLFAGYVTSRAVPTGADYLRVFRFAGVTAVESVDLTIAHGEFVTLLGPSGCGKTTTLRMVAGLEQNDTGSIAIGDRVVSDAATALFVPPDQRKLGMVFQSYALYPHMSVADNMSYSLRLRRSPKETIAAAVAGASAKLGLDPYLARRPKALSGGQRKRVGLARAIVDDDGLAGAEFAVTVEMAIGRAGAAG